MDNKNFEEYEISLEEFTTEAISEFLNYTNRINVPSNAMHLIKKMALKRYLAIQNLISNAKEGDSDVKSISQGDISITYKDSSTSEFNLTDDEKRELDRFVICKATRRIKKRNSDEDYFD